MAELVAIQPYDYNYAGTQTMWDRLGHTLILITESVRSGQTRGLIAIRSASQSELPSKAQLAILTRYMPRVIDGKDITFEQIPDDTYPAMPGRPHHVLFEWKVQPDQRPPITTRVLSVPTGITSTAYTLTF